MFSNFFLWRYTICLPKGVWPNDPLNTPQFSFNVINQGMKLTGVGDRSLHRAVDTPLWQNAKQSMGSILDNLVTAKLQSITLSHFSIFYTFRGKIKNKTSP